MSDIRTKRNWLLGITQGRWQVLEGETLNLTAVQFVEVVPAVDLARYREVLENIAYAQEFPGDEKAALEGCRAAARSVIQEKTP